MGQTYSDLKPGDECWIIEGRNYWKGKVEVVDKKDGWSSVRAIITDHRLSPNPKSFDYTSGEIPRNSYSVIPSNKEFDDLVRIIMNYKKELEDVKMGASIRENTLKDLMAYVVKMDKGDLEKLLLETGSTDKRKIENQLNNGKRKT